MSKELTVLKKPQEWVGFIEVPGLLMLRLMSRCNEKCIFCMVEEEIQKSDDVEYDEAVKRILAQPEGTRIEFFGGEPTIYPRFLDLIKLARARGHSCSIATNCRAFHSEKFTKALADLDPTQIYIRTSFYGDTAELHDYYTATPGSYLQTIKGVKNIVAAGFRCQVNIVILKQNVERLVQMTRLIHSLGVPRIKFGNLIEVSSCRQHAVRLSEVTPYLNSALKLAGELGLTITVEKTPICAAGGRIDLMSAERDLGQWSRAYDDEGECEGCLVRRWCEGLDPDYVGLFGYDGIRRMTSVDSVVLKGSAGDSAEPEYLKTHCVEISDESLDEYTTLALSNLLEKVEARLGRLAVFPRKYVQQSQGHHFR
jgi:pyruvate-formate lyase-activating enzyme